jgi:hypothetical protein
MIDPLHIHFGLDDTETFDVEANVKTHDFFAPNDQQIVFADVKNEYPIITSGNGGSLDCWILPQQIGSHGFLPFQYFGGQNIRFWLMFPLGCPPEFE